MNRRLPEDPFAYEVRRLAEAVSKAQAASREGAAALRQVDEATASRLATAEAKVANERHWAGAQLSSVAKAVGEGSSRAPDEIDRNQTIQSQVLSPDARVGLQGAVIKARDGQNGIRQGNRDLLLWKARRSSIMGGIGIAIIVLLALVGLFITQWLVTVRQDNAAATALVVSASERETAEARPDTPTPEEAPSPAATPEEDPPPAASPPIVNEQDGTIATSRPVTPTMTPRPTSRPSPTALAGGTVPPAQSLVVGYTNNGTPVEAVRFGDGDRPVVFVGGMHAGFAPSTVTLAHEAIAYFTANPDAIPDKITLYIVISASPDTPFAPGELAGRLNSNRVDANRNWGCRWTKDAKFRGETIPGSGGKSEFSEPEVMALRDFILNRGAIAAVFWEAKTVGGLVSPGSCGKRTAVSSRLASVYGAAAGYRIADFESLTNQELNGDSTNWLDSIGVPAISILLPSYESTDWNNNLNGMLAVLETFGG